MIDKVSHDMDQQFILRHFELLKLNREHAGTKLFWFDIVNIMVADAQAPRIARTSAPMILIM